MKTAGQEDLEGIAERFGLLAVYLFGSRAGDGLAVLRGGDPESSPSDLDVGVFFRDPRFDPLLLADLQVALEDLLAPLRVDLVPLDRVDPLFQVRAIDGQRVAAPDSTAADQRELLVMRQAAELLPIERRLQEERFGVATE